MSRFLWKGSWSLLCAVGAGAMTLNIPASVDCSPLSKTHSNSRPKPTSAGASTNIKASANVKASASAEGRSERTRGIDLVKDPLGFNHSVQLYPSLDGLPFQLRDGDTVTQGDRIRVSVVTSEDAQVYLTFCSKGELMVYPSANGELARAGVPMFLPQSSYLLFDGQVGPEVLYVIVSRTALSASAPRLAKELAAPGSGGTPAGCTAALDAKLGKYLPSGGSGSLPADSPPVARRNIKASPSVQLLGEDSVPEKGPSSQTSADESSLKIKPSEGSLNPGPVRYPNNLPLWGGPNIGLVPEAMIAADNSGIAIVRYGFRHVAPSAQPASLSPPTRSPSK